MKTSSAHLAITALCLGLLAAGCARGPVRAIETATVAEEHATDEPTDAPAATATATDIPPTATPAVAVEAATPTPTPTPVSGGAGPGESEVNPCAGLAGEIETQVLVGPSDAVGLEPVAVGQVPFAVTTAEAPYLVSGAGHTSYSDVLNREWGTYEVTLELDHTVGGECTAIGQEATLNLTLESTGDQLVKVEAEGFQGEYPWAGTHTFDLSFPAIEGATVEGEGYLFVLHLGEP
jgi:hypothetical protein